MASRTKLTVIFADGVILKDGIAKEGFTFPEVDPSWRVLHWFGYRGWIKLDEGVLPFENEAGVQPFYELYDGAPSNG